MLVSDLETTVTMREIYVSSVFSITKSMNFSPSSSHTPGWIVISLSSAQVMMCFLFRDLVMDFAVNPFRNFATNPSICGSVRLNKGVYFRYIEDISQSFPFSKHHRAEKNCCHFALCANIVALYIALHYLSAFRRYTMHWLRTIVQWCDISIRRNNSLFAFSRRSMLFILHYASCIVKIETAQCNLLLFVHSEYLLIFCRILIQRY